MMRLWPMAVLVVGLAACSSAPSDQVPVSSAESKPPAQVTSGTPQFASVKELSQVPPGSVSIPWQVSRRDPKSTEVGIFVAYSSCNRLLGVLVSETSRNVSIRLYGTPPPSGFCGGAERDQFLKVELAKVLGDRSLSAS